MGARVWGHGDMGARGQRGMGAWGNIILPKTWERFQFGQIDNINTTKTVYHSEGRRTNKAGPTKREHGSTQATQVHRPTN